jgi:homoserine O-acetyltransferase
MMAGIVEVVLAVSLLEGGQTAGSKLLLDPGNSEFTRAAPGVSQILIETSKGPMRIEVHRAWAPRGADRFYNLVRFGFYDGARFFRIRAGMWAQFGIPGDPNVAQAWRARAIQDDPLREPNLRGTLAYAFKDPDGRTTQVFINLRDNRSTHDKEFVPFAKIVQGVEVADALYAEYGETAGGGIRAGRQDPLFEGGNAYLAREFPKLDYIIRATIVN